MGKIWTEDIPELEKTKRKENELYPKYSVDVKTLLSDLMSSLTNGTIIIGNGWYSDPIIISGSEYENWARITTSINWAKLDTIIERDEKGKMGREVPKL